MLEGSIIERCYSRWTSAIVPVAKKDGTVRVCIDYHQVNKVTQPDPHPMPQIEEILESLALGKAIHLHPRHFEGLLSSPSSFQRQR